MQHFFASQSAFQQVCSMGVSVVRPVKSYSQALFPFALKEVKEQTLFQFHFPQIPIENQLYTDFRTVSECDSGRNKNEYCKFKN